MRLSGRSSWFFSTALSAVLLLALVIEGNRLAGRHLAFHRDWSEEKLSETSPVGTRMLHGLEDVLRVQAFFTGRPRLGTVQIAKRRLLDELQGVEREGRGRIELEFLDPNVSSEARAQAQARGIIPVPLTAVQGTSAVTQEIWFGLALGYRGREEVLPFVLPQTFESSFLSALRRLMQEREPTVGFLTGRGDGAEDAFHQIRAELGEDYRVLEVFDLGLGERVPDDVAVLVVAEPRELDPRTVFAIDQFLQRGGRALFLVDRIRVDLVKPRVERIETGLEQALQAWGALPCGKLVWDQERANRLTTRETAGGNDLRIPYPFWPNLDRDGMDAENPATARLEGADLFWVQAFEASAVPGLEARPLLQSSRASWLVEPELALVLDPSALGARAANLLAQEPDQAQRRVLALGVSGRFPSPFESGAPAPRDPLGERPSASGGTRTDEQVASRSASTQIVVFGDADWARDGKFLTERNRSLFVQLVDWLALEDDLLALRSRTPRQRTVADFLEEERRALGLSGAGAERGPAPAGRPDAIARLEEQAQARAARRRWWVMGKALSGAIVGGLVLACLAKFCFGRSPRISRT